MIWGYPHFRKRPHGGLLPSEMCGEMMVKGTVFVVKYHGINQQYIGNHLEFSILPSEIIGDSTTTGPTVFTTALKTMALLFHVWHVGYKSIH